MRAHGSGDGLQGAVSGETLAQLVAVFLSLKIGEDPDNAAPLVCHKPVCVCVCACVRACMRVCVRESVCVRVRARGMHTTACEC